MKAENLTIEYSQGLMECLENLREIWKHAFERVDLPGLPLEGFFSPSYPLVKHWNIVLPANRTVTFTRENIEMIRRQYQVKNCAPFFQIPTGYASSVKMNAYFSKMKDLNESTKSQIAILPDIKLTPVEPAHFGKLVAINIDESEQFGRDFAIQMERLEDGLQFAQSFSVNHPDNAEIGCISIFSSDLNIFWLKNLIIHRHYRRQGIGIAAMESVESFVPPGKRIFVQLGTPQETREMVLRLNYTHISDTTLCSAEEILKAIP